jgi:hypothetical protein
MRITATHYQQEKTPAGPGFHLICCLTYTLLCLGWSVWAGRDQSWDQLNYHLYVAQAWWQNRLPEELFAASSQGYLNPLAHLPFFAAYSTGWNSILITIMVAALHSTNLWLLHFIAVELTPPSNRLRRLMVFCGVVLGGLTPAFLIEVGGSFTDVVVSIPSLGALLCLLYWIRNFEAGASRQAWRLLYMAGLLAGLSMGLKPSALVFCGALALAAILLAPSQRWSVLWRTAASGLAGLALTAGPHAFMLWESFGNPVFPLFNGVFQSSWFVSANVVSERFRPSSLIDALRYPLDLANAFNRVGFESIAVDIRPIVLISLLIVIGLLTLLRKSQATIRNSPETRPSRLFCITLVAFFPAWLYTSGNSRYALQAFLLLGPALGLAVTPFSTRSPIWPMLALGLPLAAQGAATFTLNATRWDEHAWSRSWFDLKIPEQLHSRPAYYLSLQTQSYSALATVLPPESRFTNLLGQTPLNPTGLVWDHVRQDQKRKGLPWRSLYAIPMLIAPSGVPLGSLDTQDAQLSEYGLKVDRSDCHFIVLDGTGQPPLKWVKASPEASFIKELQREVILSCALLTAPPLAVAETARRKSVDARMNSWEQRCPAYFAPPKTQSEQLIDQRRRMYVSTENLLIESDDQLLASSMSSSNIIRLEDQQGRHLIDHCPEKHSH